MASLRPATAYLALGGNLGEPVLSLAEARNRLSENSMTILKASGLYRTPPFGPVKQPPFINQCLAVSTELAPHALLDTCLAIETAMGRVRIERWGPRLIDIDLLCYDGVTIDDDKLSLPHKGMLERAFVLVPLLEIAPELVIGKTRIADALAGLDRTGIVRID